MPTHASHEWDTRLCGREILQIPTSQVRDVGHPNGLSFWRSLQGRNLLRETGLAGKVSAVGLKHGLKQGGSVGHLAYIFSCQMTDASYLSL